MTGQLSLEYHQYIKFIELMTKKITESTDLLAHW